MAFVKNRNIKILLFLTIIFCGFFLLPAVYAADLGETKKFFVDPVYDYSGRKEVSSELVNISDKLYIYVDTSVWSGMSMEEKNDTKNNLSVLSAEFEKNIYPTLTSNYGFEWKPGIDNDNRITILFHSMRRGSGGYFNSGNEYTKFEVPASNEREMIFLNANYLSSGILKNLLAHEFTHLITFNQKEKIYNTEEDVWLNEGRAEYALTLCGYDADYPGSNLQKRVVEFIKNPSDSITEWEDSSSDYGALNIFIQYLVDQYGVKILNDSMHSNKVGKESINYALQKNGYKEDFSKVFTNWTIAVAVNNCSLGKEYCYKNMNLKNLKVIPSDSILPKGATGAMSVTYSAKDWAGNWQKFSGGDSGNLSLDFSAPKETESKSAYVPCDNSNRCFIKFIDLDKDSQAHIAVADFNKNYKTLVVISSVQDGGYSGQLYFSLKAEIKPENSIPINSDNTEEETKKNLLAQIELVKKQIEEARAIIEKAKGQNNNAVCKKITGDLYFGLENNPEVSCLQAFLKNQGSGIYPEGIITGNFLRLTKAAVIRFQEKFSDEILKPLGLLKGTGYVGEKTRAKINQMLNN